MNRRQFLFTTGAMTTAIAQPRLARVWGDAAMPRGLPAGAKPCESATIQYGDLAVTFRDNAHSPGVLSGIASLRNIRHAPKFEAFDPDEPAASAGLNFEHISAGHQSPHNAFTPRIGPFSLFRLPGDRSVMLVRRAEDCPWRVASTLKYTVVEPYYVDFDYRCTPQDASFFAPRGYAMFFFANYMNDVAQVPIHFRGIEQAGGTETWIAADAPPGHPDWQQGGTYRHVSALELERDDDLRFRLNHWSYDWPRYTAPFYYGRAEHGMTLVLMFDRAATESDQIRFSLFKFKLDRRPRPAWDFQYVVNRVEADQEYGFSGRLVWKKFTSPADCLREYERWHSGGPS